MPRLAPGVPLLFEWMLTVNTVAYSHQRRDRPHPQVRLRPAHRVDVQRQRRLWERAADHRRAGGALNPERRQRPRQHRLELGVVLRRAGVEEPVLVEQTFAGPDHIPGVVVRRHDPPAPVKLHNAQPCVVEQRRQGRTQRAGPGQRLLRAHALTDMGQETLDRVELGGRPDVPVDRVVDDPDDPRAIRPVQAHVDAVAGAGAGQQLVVRRGGLARWDEEKE